jgi:hypothetical protein
MAITGTKQPRQTNGMMKNYFVNNCTIDSAEQAESPYHDCSVRVQLTDTSNGYNYNLFVNQNFEKDTAGVVVDLSFPDNLNTLYLSSGADINVSDNGKVNLTDLIGKEIAVINYMSNGKYKKQIWQTVGKSDDHDALTVKFEKSVKDGYPKNFIGYSSSTEEVADLKTEVLKSVPKSDGMPF